tara:strand:- start:1959 stop:2252 length:294 start_codon:yes stop_codon:yes gene_type:complete
MKISKARLSQIIKETIDEMDKSDYLKHVRGDAAAKRAARAAQMTQGEVPLVAALDQVIDFVQSEKGNQATGSVRTKVQDLVRLLKIQQSQPDTGDTQ